MTAAGPALLVAALQEVDPDFFCWGCTSQRVISMLVFICFFSLLFGMGLHLTGGRASTVTGVLLTATIAVLLWFEAMLTK
jgi:hypothetical protein